MNDLEKLTEYFREFPGIGPRQAKRFVYFLLRKNDNYIKELSNLIPKIKQNTAVCSRCQKYFTKRHNENLCDICSSKNRDPSKLMIVARDTDLETIEKSGSFNGFYFVLGGLLPHLEEDAQKFIRIKELKELLLLTKEKAKEIILALNANPDGDNTANYLKKFLSKEFSNVKISVLGRGLSTGSELEYADKETIFNALENRK
jgi:recombination protein RecR